MHRREPAAFGKIPYTEVEDDRHGEGFDKAFRKALDDLDGQKYAGEKLEVRAYVTISSNPGGVSQYTVTLIPTG